MNRGKPYSLLTVSLHHYASEQIYHNNANKNPKASANLKNK